MFESFNPDDAISLLKADHAKVKDLFAQFEKSDDLRHKKKIVAEALTELKMHAEIEEKIFYPAVRPRLEKDTMNEADEEHHVARILISELSLMDGSEDHYCMKFKVLAENVRHHIREEESEMLPEARKLEIDFAALGRKMLALKGQMKRNGVPPCAEEKMISHYGARDDSPARSAELVKPAKTQKKKAQNNNAGKSSKHKAV